MLNLHFAPYFTTISSGKLDLSKVSTIKEDEDLIVIHSPEVNVFYIADSEGIRRIFQPLERNKDTPEGRQDFARFYNAIYVTSKEMIGKYICSIMAIRSWSAKVFLEPMENSIKATVTPLEHVEENACTNDEWKPNLSDTIEQVLLGGLDHSVIGYYCDAMPDTAESLQELKNNIEDYDILELYECLFSCFKDKLSPDEIRDYRAAYRKIFDKDLCPYFESDYMDNEENS